MLGGEGTREGALKGWVTRRAKGKKKPTKKKKTKCIETDNVEIYSKNVKFNIPDETIEDLKDVYLPKRISTKSNNNLMDDAQKFLNDDIIDMQMTSQDASPLEKSIDTKVNRMSSKDVIALNNKLSSKNILEFKKSGRIDVDDIKDKLAKAKFNLKQGDIFKELEEKDYRSKLKKASDRKLKPRPKEPVTIHSSLMEEIHKRPLIGGFVDCQGGSFYDPKEYRHAHLSNNFNILMNERNRYGFGY